MENDDFSNSDTHTSPVYVKHCDHASLPGFPDASGITRKSNNTDLGKSHKLATP